MYFRYLMWNFSGRQNDVKWENDLLNGNWISGIKFIDEYRLGPQSNLPDDAENNKAKNTYYMLPFILGIIGFLFLFREDKNLFWIVTLLFLFTGLALKVYLNERIFEPRERDYALVGSFYIFAIYIGLSLFSILNFGKNAFIANLSSSVVLRLGHG